MPKIGAPRPTAGEPQPDTMLEAALDWAKRGWPVFPLRPGTKIPLFGKAHPDDPVLQKTCQGACGEVGHGVHDATLDPDTIRQWWEKTPRAGIGGSTDGRVVIDLDYQHGAERQAILPPTREHLSGRGNGNTHLVYQAGGEIASNMPQGKLGQGIDVKAGPAAYVVLPPTLHPDTNKPYTVGNDLPEHYLTDEDIRTIWEAHGANLPASARGAARGIRAVEPETPPKPAPTRIDEEKTLAWLLNNPPERGTGGTNDWLAKVAGHYAKLHHNKRDLYETEVRRACAMVDENYEDLQKTLDSIWGTELVNNPERGATPDTGWLQSMGREMYCMARLAGETKGESVPGLMPYANFNMVARGVMVDEDGHRVYQVLLQTRHADIETTISGAVLADKRKLNAWLLPYGATIAPYEPERVHPSMEVGTRLLRYLESQDAPPVKVVDRLGWDNGTGQFVTHDGAIRDTGAVGVAESGVIADRSRVDHKTAKYHYGFEGSWEEAQAVLQEVQTYHFTEVVHLMGAWWAACFLKPQAMQHTSLFPYFGVEAASGSAKTNGYFNLMVQLGGNYHGQVAATKASFRDSAATSNNGILWADDMDHPDTLQEILRAATSGGTIRKMSEERQAVDFTLSNPLLFTGEELRVSDQKALLERGVLIRPASPTERTSQKPGREGKSQWTDISELQNRYRGEHSLAELAGWYVQRALQVADRFSEAVAGFAQEHRGRNADKYAILRAGARLLDFFLTDDYNVWAGVGETAQWVDAWVQKDVASKTDIEHDNRITQKVIPWAIQALGLRGGNNPSPVNFSRSWEQAPPVLVEQVEADQLDMSEVWVNTRLLAQAWSESKAGRVDTRLETEESLQNQLMQIAYPAKTERKSVRVGGVSVKYRRLLDGYAQLVLQRVQGDDLVD